MPLLSILGIIAIIVGVLGLLGVIAFGTPVAALFILVGIALVVVDRGGFIRR